MKSETELLYRLVKRQGVGVVYVPAASVHHVVQPAQLTVASLPRRGGRSAVRLEWDRWVVRAGRQILGAPGYVWRMAVQAGARYAVLLPAGRCASLPAGLRFAYLLGSLHAYRSRGTSPGRAVPLPS